MNVGFLTGSYGWTSQQRTLCMKYLKNRLNISNISFFACWLKLYIRYRYDTFLTDI